MDEPTGHTGEAAPTLGYVAPMGTEVRAADGERLGRVAACWPSHVFVEASPGADAGWWIPVGAFAVAADEALVADATRAEAERRGWGERPEGGPQAAR